MTRTKRLVLLGLLLALPLLLSACVAETEQVGIPGVTLSVEPGNTPEKVNTGIQLLVLLTVLSVAPTILLMMTSFTRIVIVFSMLRSAIGTPTVPPNQVIIGLALFMTFFIMAPVFTQVDQQAIQPYLRGDIDQNTAFDQAMAPMRQFMFKQAREKDIDLFLQISGNPRPRTLDDIPNSVILPAFMISELHTAFVMAFVIYIPFLVIDMVISSILLAMGMMMLPPSLVSMPFKLLLFIMVDGWYLITKSLTLSFLQ